MQPQILTAANIISVQSSGEDLVTAQKTLKHIARLTNDIKFMQNIIMSYVEHLVKFDRTVSHQ